MNGECDCFSSEEEALNYNESFFPNGSFESFLDSQVELELQKDYQAKLDPITQMQNRLKRSIPKIQQGLWCTADKRVLKISEMETKHLINSIAQLKRTNWHSSYNDVLLAITPLEQELNSR
jgi:hypothetical protein